MATEPGPKPKPPEVPIQSKATDQWPGVPLNESDDAFDVRQSLYDDRKKFFRDALAGWVNYREAWISTSTSRGDPDLIGINDDGSPVYTTAHNAKVDAAATKASEQSAAQKVIDSETNKEIGNQLGEAAAQTAADKERADLLAKRAAEEAEETKDIEAAKARNSGETSTGSDYDELQKIKEEKKIAALEEQKAQDAAQNAEQSTKEQTEFGAINDPTAANQLAASSAKASAQIDAAYVKEVADFKAANVPKETVELETQDAEDAANISVSLLLSNAVTMVANSAFRFPEKATIAGLESVQDPATIIIIGSDSKMLYQTNKFILTALTKQSQERFQVVETFGEPTIQFFNERTKIYTLQGVLIDGMYKQGIGVSEGAKKPLKQITREVKYQWAQAFEQFYRDHLRATKLKQKEQKAAIYVNNTIIKGYPLSLTLSKESSAMPDCVSFQMTWVIETDTLLKAADASYLYDGGVAWDPKFKEVLENYQKDLTAYNKALMDFNAATTLDRLKTLKAVLDQITVYLKDSAKKLKDLLNNTNYVMQDNPM